MDICIIVDTSISVDPTEWDELRRFVQDTVNTLEIGPTESQVGFVTYSHVAVVSANLNKFVDSFCHYVLFDFCHYVAFDFCATCKD